MAEHEDKMKEPLDATEQPQTSRREFVKRVGAFVFSLVLLSRTKSARASCVDGGCDGTPPNTSCDSPGESDGSCGWFGDTDGGCGAGENDGNCPAAQDQDQNCQPPCSDSYDVDNDCNTPDGPNDGSCGDCDDNHDTDNHCGLPNPGDDPDDLCGHPHYIGLDEDNNCTATHGPDSYCGTYNFDYQWFADTDYDQHCHPPEDPDNKNDDRTGSCGSDTNKPEWHYSGS